MLRDLLRKLLVCCTLVWWIAAGHAGPAAGVYIRNTALATFVDSSTQMSVRLNSGTVSIRVSGQEALALAGDHDIWLASGAPFAISHTVTNTGNVDASFALAAVPVAGAMFTPLNLRVIHDVNRNGVADPGEPVIPATGILVAAGASASVLVTGEVPSTATPGQRTQLTITATSQGQGVRASSTDTLTITAWGAVQVTLSASDTSAVASSPLTWSAVAVNNGAAPCAAMPVLVDGASTSAFVLRAPVPANTALESAWTANTNSRIVYHLAGNPAGSYVSALPAGATADAVAWLVPELAAGSALKGEFRVKVAANATGVIRDVAYADWWEQGVAALATSNTVQLPLPARAPQIAFYADEGYARISTQNMPGGHLYVQADAAMCNADPARAESVPVRVTSQLTGDVETFTAVETGPNSGVFRIVPDVPTANAATHVVASADGILEVLRNDLVTATLSACGGVAVTASTSLLIDPSGVVFDSRSNLPIPGAAVELIDVTGAGNGGRAGQAATVLQLDGSTPAPSRVVTGADGVYVFPLVPPSTYRLRVTPPAGLLFPSQLPPALQPAGRVIDAPGSYGGSFEVGTGAVRFDLPLDTGGSGLMLQKTASRATAEVGDFVDYVVRVNNTLVVPLPQVQVRDALPAGFAYVRGSARLEGKPLPDPVNAGGAQLAFTIGNVPAGGQPSLTYRVRIGAGSAEGNGINTAQAIGGGVSSNRATARVQVLGGVFSSDAYIIGKVFADCGRDGVQSGDEPGIPGVRIYLEDGTYAVTDEEGKYSFYGLTPRTHVAKVDRTTLPAGATLQVLGTRHGMDAGSRFADLKVGELHKADFAIGECDAGVREQIAARRKALANPAEIVQAAVVLLSATPQGSPGDARTLPASGALGLPGASLRSQPAGALPGLGAVADTGASASVDAGLPRPIFTPAAAVLAQQAPGAAVESQALPAVAPDAVAPLEEVIEQLSPEVAFVGLVEGQALPGVQTRVRVKGPLGGAFELTVNGQPVPVTQVGKRSSLERSGVAAWEYIGVDLRAGRNVLAVKVQDGFGNVRGQAQVSVLAPGALAAVRIGAPERPVADAATPVPVTVALQDADGLAVSARTQLTLHASGGQWQVADSDPHQAGTQVMVEGGTARFLLVPPAQPGKVEITVLAGTVKSSVGVEFVPLLRPLVAAGIVEGALNLRKLAPSALKPAQGGDTFEREIRSVSRSFSDGRAEVGARAALFLKGKVLGSSLLTLAYDSDKPADMRLFRDIQPNQFYPVYGDSSARGYEAQSTGHLYVLLQDGANYALLGDFSTQSDNPARQLTQYSRALNGAKGRWSDGQVTVEAFASRTAATQVVQEFRANGTSGPFQLNPNGVVQSEQVHVITRSRNQPALVLKDTPLSRFADYTIEPITGLLLLKAPVPSVDAELDPVFVRVSYDVENGGPRHNVEGIEATFRVAPGITVGAVGVRDDDPAKRQQLEGVTLQARLAERTVLNAEIARSHTDLHGTGQGERVDFRHEAPGVEAHAWAVHTDTGFDNPNSPQSAGQAEYGAKGSYALDAANRLVGEVLRTANAATGAQQVGAELKLEHSLPGNARIEVGLRHGSSNAQAALSAPPAPGTSTPVLPASAAAASTEHVATTSARAKLTVPVPGVPQADAYAVAEQAIDGSGGREVGVGANYALNANTRLYARHDFINSLNGPYTLSRDVSRYTSVAGIDTVLPGNTHLFNEYRVGDSIDGRTAQAAIGLRKTMQLAAGFSATASVQRLKPLSGPATEDSTAIALGAEYTEASSLKASTQLQWQTSVASRSWLASAAVVKKLDAEWTWLNRVLYSQQTNTGGSTGERELLVAQSGVAFRPVADNRWNALARIEYKRDHDTTVAAARDASAWMFSTHVNFQPEQAWVLSGRYAARWLHDGSPGLSARSITQLFGLRSTWDLGERWNLGLQAYRMWGNGASDEAVGLEIGYLAWKNVWVGAGYNFRGFSAPELGGEARTARGAYLRLRMKFDEEALQGVAGAGAQPAAPEAAAGGKR